MRQIGAIPEPGQEVRQLVGRGRLALGPSFCPYSPECIEGVSLLKK
jgi:hypothetical protein